MSASHRAASGQPAADPIPAADAGVPSQRPPGAEPDADGGRSASGRASYAAPMMLGDSGWLAILFAAIAFFVVRVIMLAWPPATLTIVAILIGAALVVAGVVRLLDGFTAHEESGGRRAADVVIGLLAVIVGLYCLRHHALSIAIVAFIVGVFWVLHGIADLAVAATVHGVPPGILPRTRSPSRCAGCCASTRTLSA